MKVVEVTVMMVIVVVMGCGVCVGGCGYCGDCDHDDQEQGKIALPPTSTTTP